jgi:hypothetical protein
MKLGRKICNKGTPTTCSVSRFFAPLPLVPLTSGLCSDPWAAPAAAATPRRRPGGPAAGTKKRPAGHAFRAWPPHQGRSGSGVARGDRGPAMRRRVGRIRPASRASAPAEELLAEAARAARMARENRRRAGRESRERRERATACDGARRERATAQGCAQCRRPAARAAARERPRASAAAPRRRPGGPAAGTRESPPGMRFVRCMREPEERRVAPAREARASRERTRRAVSRGLAG